MTVKNVCNVVGPALVMVDTKVVEYVETDVNGAVLIVVKVEV